MKNKNYIRPVSYIFASLLVAFGFFIDGRAAHTRLFEREMLDAERALSRAASSLEGLAGAFALLGERVSAANTAPEDSAGAETAAADTKKKSTAGSKPIHPPESPRVNCADILSDIRLYSDAVRCELDRIGLDGIRAEKLWLYLSGVSDISHLLLRKTSDFDPGGYGETLLRELEQYAAALYSELIPAIAAVPPDSGDYYSVYSVIDKIFAGFTPHYAPQLSGLYRGTGSRGYDSLRNATQIGAGEAMRIAHGLLGDNARFIRSEGVSFPYIYCFICDNASVEISREGGFVLRMLYDTPDGNPDENHPETRTMIRSKSIFSAGTSDGTTCTADEKTTSNLKNAAGSGISGGKKIFDSGGADYETDIGEEEAAGRAAEFLGRLGLYDQMELIGTNKTAGSGIYIAEYAHYFDSPLGRILCRSERVTAGISARNGRVCVFDADKYYKFHKKKRELPAADAIIGAAELGKTLEYSGGISLVIIEAASGREVLCYELTGFGGKERYYVNAETGGEEIEVG